MIALDRFPERLALARKGKAKTINYDSAEDDVVEILKEMTGGIGPDACIDAVGMEAHGKTIGALYDRTKQAARLQLDRPVSRCARQFRPVAKAGSFPFLEFMAATSIKCRWARHSAKHSASRWDRHTSTATCGRC